jgi:hypothetical protein
MAFTEKIRVVIDVAADNAASSFRKLKTDVAAAEGAMGKLKAGGGAALAGIKANALTLAAAGGAALVTFGAKAVAAASDLQESANAVNVTFGDSAEGIHALGEAAADTVGLSNAAFNSMAVQFSSFATTVAGEGGDVVDVIDDLSTRAADFASVMNIDVAEAARVFQSGLAGETEPLKKFGINLAAAEVEAYALREGLIDVGETMSEATKVQARYGLLMELTSKTSGDFKNTSDSLANSQRRVKAQLTNVSAEIGARLIPAIEDAIPVVEGLIDVLDKIGGTSIENPFQFDTQDTVDSIIEATGEMEHYHSEFEGGIDLSKRYSDTQNLVAREVANAKVEFDEAARLTAMYAERMHGAEASVRDALKAQERQNEVLAEQRDRFQSAADAVYNLHDAERAAYDAIKAANEILEDEDASLYDIRAANEDAVKAIDDVITAQVEAAGVTRDSVAGNRKWNEAMLYNASTMEGPVAKATLEHIARMNGIPEEKITEIMAQDNAALVLADHLTRLGRIPPVVTTRLRVTGQTVGSDGRLIGVRATDITKEVRGATGGIVTQPTMALIGEAGPEAVIPLNKAPGASPLPTGASSDGARINLTVNAGMGADGARIGNMIIETIKQYERHNGAGWRS